MPCGNFLPRFLRTLGYSCACTPMAQRSWVVFSGGDALGGGAPYPLPHSQNGQCLSISPKRSRQRW